MERKKSKRQPQKREVTFESKEDQADEKQRRAVSCGKLDQRLEDKHRIQKRKKPTFG